MRNHLMNCISKSKRKIYLFHQFLDLNLARRTSPSTSFSGANVRCASSRACAILFRFRHGIQTNHRPVKFIFLFLPGLVLHLFSFCLLLFVSLLLFRF